MPKPTYPVIEFWPMRFEGEVSEDGERMVYRVTQPYRIASRAGLLPLVTLPGHEATTLEETIEATAYACGSCGRQLLDLNPAEAYTEAWSVFNAEELADASRVCDDCWRAMRAAMPDLDERYPRATPMTTDGGPR